MEESLPKLNIGSLVREYFKSLDFLNEEPESIERRARSERERILDDSRKELYDAVNNEFAPVAREYFSAVIRKTIDGDDSKVDETRSRMVTALGKISDGKQRAIRSLYAERCVCKWMLEKVSELKSALEGRVVASIKEYANGEGKRRLNLFKNPFEPLKFKSNGTLSEAAVPRPAIKVSSDGSVSGDNADNCRMFIPVAQIDWEDCMTNEVWSDALLLPLDRVNIIAMDQARFNCRCLGKTLEGILANFILRTLVEYAPDVKIIAYSDYSAVRNIDHNLREERDLKGLLSLPDDFRMFCKTLDEAIKAQPSDLALHRKQKSADKRPDIVAIYVLPDKPAERGLEEVRETLSGYCAAYKRGVHFLLAGTWECLNAYGILKGGFGNYLFEYETTCIPSEFYGDAVACDNDLNKKYWYPKSPARFAVKSMNTTALTEGADAQKYLAALVSLIKPPRKEVEGAIGVTLAYDAASEPFDLVYSAAQASSLFLTGAPGTGKSFTLNSFIYNACLAHSPERLQLLLLDCKDCVEMMKFASLPHVKCVVNSDYDILMGVMSYLDKEQKRRNKIFRKCGVSDIDAYNKKAKDNPSLENLPRILLIVDEFGRLLEKTGSHEAEQKRKRMLDEINRLVAITRFAGIHYLCATQTDSEFRDAFKAGLFSFKAKLLQSMDGRRSMEFVDVASGQGGSEKMLTLYPKVEPNPDERFTDKDLEAIHAKWNSVKTPRSVICSDSSALPIIEEYPDVEAKMSAFAERSNQEEIFLASGIKISNIFEMASIPYAYGMEKPHLFVSGALEYTVDDEKVHCACPAFLSAQIQSIANLAETGMDVAAEIVDVRKVLWWRPDAKGVRRYSSKGAFRSAVEAWDRRRREEPDAWNFLVVVNAERYLDPRFGAEVAEPNRVAGSVPAGLEAKPDTSKMTPLEKLKYLKSMAGGTAPKPADATPSLQCAAQDADPVQTVRTAFLSDEPSHSVIILHSSQPAVLDELLRGRDSSRLAHNRYVLFRLANAEFSRKITSPSSFKIGELTDTCETDDPSQKSGFVAFQTLEADEEEP